MALVSGPEEMSPIMRGVVVVVGGGVSSPVLVVAIVGGVDCGTASLLASKEPSTLADSTELFIGTSIVYI